VLAQLAQCAHASCPVHIFRLAGALPAQPSYLQAALAATSQATTQTAAQTAAQTSAQSPSPPTAAAAAALSLAAVCQAAAKPCAALPPASQAPQASPILQQRRHPSLFSPNSPAATAPAEQPAACSLVAFLQLLTGCRPPPPAPQPAAARASQPVAAAARQLTGHALAPAAATFRWPAAAQPSAAAAGVPATCSPPSEAPQVTPAWAGRYCCTRAQLAARQLAGRARTGLQCHQAPL
jgi:hypothetical protein